MAIVSVDIPNDVIKKIGIGKEISYEFLISKTIGIEYLSPDLEFTNYENMSEEHKREYNKIENINKASLLNI